MSKSVVVRFHEYCIQEKSAPLNRLSGFMYGSSMVDLIDEFLNEKYASDDMELLESNPRNPKRSGVTGDIILALQDTPELFPLMSKGVLISTNTCTRLERNRFEITFVNPKVNGILDGGHNTLAIALFFLGNAGASDKEIRKVKRWSDLKELWNKYSDVISETKKTTKFLVPSEIIYPKHANSEDLDFVTSIMEIARARNNNTQLSEETKSNKMGHYEAIKEFVDPDLFEKIEWKTNDGGLIKVRELIALSLIPLSKTAIGKDVNPVHIYSSKAECVGQFDKIILTDGISQPSSSGEFLREVVDPVVLSALRMINRLPELYDLIYEKLPDAYNKSSNGKFGLITSVSASAGKTKYYGKPIDYTYPEGFMMPLVYSLSELMTANKSGKLSWITEPAEFITTYLNDIMASYGELVIKMSAYDPQKVGKNRGSYVLASMAVRDVLMRNKLI
ncbi:MAG: hypothetical protein LLG15_12310 [Betaproteobacteria bacterium]|nr:hypothetical protein [Betaproteobacteria bacterium]